MLIFISLFNIDGLIIKRTFSSHPLSNRQLDSHFILEQPGAKFLVNMVHHINGSPITIMDPSQEFSQQLKDNAALPILELGSHDIDGLEEPNNYFHEDGGEIDQPLVAACQHWQFAVFPHEGLDWGLVVQGLEKQVPVGLLV
jgi:hypothetical protein